MDEFKGTEGEWIISEELSNWIISENHGDICRISLKNGSDGTKERANAHLVAAAPDNLKQLKIEVEFLNEVIGMLKNCDSSSINISKVNSRIGRIQQDIDKALGKETKDV